MDAKIVEDERQMAARFRRLRANLGARPLRSDYSDCTCPDNGDSCEPCAGYHHDRKRWELDVEGAVGGAMDQAKDGG